MKRLHEVWSVEPDADASGAVAMTPQGNLEIRDLTFAYDTRPVLRDIHFDVRHGQTVGIVGRTGSGSRRCFRSSRARSSRRRARSSSTAARPETIPDSSAARVDRHGAAGDVPLFGVDRGEHPLRTGGRDERGSRRSRRAGRTLHRRRGIPAGPRNRHRRARHHALRRAEAAHCDRAAPSAIRSS
jgi:hypothetical protein